MDDKFLTVDMISISTRTTVYSQEVPASLLVHFILSATDFDTSNQSATGYGFIVKDFAGNIVRRFGLN